MAEKEIDVEYLYRMRTWDKNVWYANENMTREQLEKGWGAWEYITAEKYKEILSYIAWDQPCHYQAEKLLVTVVGHDSFDPVAWSAERQSDVDKAREERMRPKTETAPSSGSAMSMNSSPSQSSLIDGYGLIHMAEGVLRSIGNGISSTASATVDVAGDCVSAIGDGISSICD